MTAGDVRVLALAAVAGDRLTSERRRAIVSGLALTRRAALQGVARLPRGAERRVGIARAGELTLGVGLALLDRAIDAVVRAIFDAAAGAALGGRAVGARATFRPLRAERARRAFQVRATRARMAGIGVRTLRITAARAAALPWTTGAAAGTRRVIAQLIDAGVVRARILVVAISIGRAAFTRDAARGRAILVLVHAGARGVRAEAGKALVVGAVDLIVAVALAATLTTHAVAAQRLIARALGRVRAHAVGTTAVDRAGVRVHAVLGVGTERRPAARSARRTSAGRATAGRRARHATERRITRGRPARPGSCARPARPCLRLAARRREFTPAAGCGDDRTNEAQAQRANKQVHGSNHSLRARGPLEGAAEGAHDGVPSASGASTFARMPR